MARRGRTLAPADASGPLVEGRCLEEAGDYDQALSLYAEYLESHGGHAGAAAVEGRRLIALRGQARAQARRVLAGEAQFAPSDAQAVAVMPFLVDGAAEYQPLAAGLAHMLTTDLAVLERFPLVERLQLDALLAEQNLSPGRVDPATAARTGRLTGASRIVVGTLSLTDGRSAALGGEILVDSGETQTAAIADGVLSELLDMEKEYALQVAEKLGYVLSDAERQAVLRNRPRSMTSFLSFSRGLLAEGMGDFGAAAAFFQEAARSDPGFADAALAVRRTVAAEVVSQAGPGDAEGAVARVEGRLGSLQIADPVSGAIATSVLDVASHQPERATVDSGQGRTPIDTVPDPDPPLSLQALITIVIRIPR